MVFSELSILTYPCLGHLATRGAARRRAKALWRHFGDTLATLGDTLATLGDTGQRFISGSIRPQLDISIDRLRALPAGSGPEMRQFCKVACATAMLKHARTDPPQLLSYSTAGFSTVHDIPSMYDWLTGQWYWMVSIVVVDRTTVVDVSHRRCTNGRTGQGSVSSRASAVLNFLFRHGLIIFWEAKK